MSSRRPAIDAHVHVLPDLDDGPASIEESVRLAAAAVADGVGTIVATPHLRDDHPGVVPAELASRCDELRTALARREIALELVVGGEVDLIWAGRVSDDELRLVSYGQRGDWLLVETPYSPLPRHFDQLLFEIELRGFRIVLAHPERNPSFQDDLGRVAELAERGMLLQVTASSLVPGSSRPARAARALVKRRIAHLIASDAHGVGRHRRIDLSAGEAAARTLAPERASWMVRDAPAALLAGELPSAPDPPAASGAARLGRLRRRLGSE